MVHGWGGFPDEGWRPWLKTALEEKGFEVLIPAMPATNNPVFSKWLTHLQKVVGTPDKDTYFIGHSLGCITVLRYLEALQPSEKVGGVIMVAGFGKDLIYEGYKQELKSFFETPIKWDDIKSHCDKFFALYSKDDKWVDGKNLELFEEKLNAEIKLENGMKHYSGNDGIIELPLVLDKLLEMSS